MLYFSSTKIGTGLQKGLLYITQYFKCSLHKQTKGNSIYHLPKKLNAVIDRHYMSPLALSPPQKEKIITTEYINLQPAGILSDRSQLHDAENYPWTCCCVTQTNSQRGVFPNTAKIRVITDYKSTTGQAVAVGRAVTPKFWHQFPSQEPPALSQVPHHTRSVGTLDHNH